MTAKEKAYQAVETPPVAKMSLLDFFAGHALSIVLPGDPESVAKRAYDLAIAMLDEAEERRERACMVDDQTYAEVDDMNF